MFRKGFPKHLHCNTLHYDYLTKNPILTISANSGEKNIRIKNTLWGKTNAGEGRSLTGQLFLINEQVRFCWAVGGLSAQRTCNARFVVSLNIVIYTGRWFLSFDKFVFCFAHLDFPSLESGSSWILLRENVSIWKDRIHFHTSRRRVLGVLCLAIGKLPNHDGHPPPSSWWSLLMDLNGSFCCFFVYSTYNIMG